MATSKPTAKPSKATRRTRAAQSIARPKPRAKLPASVPKKPKNLTVADPIPKKRWSRTPKADRPQYHKLPNVLIQTKLAYRLLARNWTLVIGIALIYGLLNVILVRGLNGSLNVAELKGEFNQLYKGGWGNIASGFSVFALLVSSSNSNKTSDAAGAYQSFLIVITSLALVWGFRQMLADKTHTVRLRDAFYQGMYPLIPVILVLLVISLQLIPVLAGGFLFTLVISNGIAVSSLEVGAWLIVLIGSILWSLVLVVPSIFALYIATLPEMTPLKALRSAKKLVRFRRFTVLRKVLFLPLLVFIGLAVIILPIIFTVPVLAQWVFFALSMLILPIVHAYLYTLYRELLNE